MPLLLCFPFPRVCEKLQVLCIAGISVECQVDRSQIRNRETAMRTLKARIYHREMEDQISKTQAERKLQVNVFFNNVASC